MDNIRINFYSFSKASVNISYEPDTPPHTNYGMRQYLDAFLFACYSLRMMQHLGQFNTEILYHAYSNWSYEPLNFNATLTQPSKLASKVAVIDSQTLSSAAVSAGALEKRAEKLYGESAFLVPHKGNTRQYFGSGLNIKPPNFGAFKIKPNGFGLLNTRFVVPAIHSVFILYVYLAEIHNSPDFLRSLASLASRCFYSFAPWEHRDLKTTNTLALAQEYLQPTFDKNGPLIKSSEIQNVQVGRQTRTK